MSDSIDWDVRFLQLAELVSGWSKDPSTKVGAVVTDSQKRVVSLGFNGFPRGVADSKELLENREEKYKRIIHAEQNAILFGNSKELTGCTLFVYPFPPCNRCALEIIQSGITRVVSLRDYPERWKEAVDVSLELFKEANVVVDLY